MKILMVSPYPPYRDGIGRYAEQEVEKLKADGNTVEVLSPLPSAAHHHANLRGGLRMLRIRRYARAADRVILQYQPSHFHTKGRGFSRVWSNLGMLLTFLSTKHLWVVCHEVDYPRRKIDPWVPDFLLERLAWRFAPHVLFHSSRELEAMKERLRVSPRSATVKDPGESVTPAISETKSQARSILELDQDVTMLLCIGFIQPHKGYDRAVMAFAQVDPPDAILVIAGSVRTDDISYRDHLDGLKAAAAGNSKIHIHEAMLSDEEFDRYIVASDVLLLPYREIWSSAVIERAKLYNTQVIATRVGALPEQVRESDVIVDNDEQLMMAIAEATGASTAHAADPSDSLGLDYEAATQLLEEASRRRRRTTRALGVEGAINRLRTSSELRTLFPEMPSRRPVIGPLVTIAKRFLGRFFGWYLRPVVEQLEERFDTHAEAAEELKNEIDVMKVRIEQLETELQEIKRSR